MFNSILKKILNNPSIKPLWINNKLNLDPNKLKLESEMNLSKKIEEEIRLKENFRIEMITEKEKQRENMLRLMIIKIEEKLLRRNIIIMMIDRKREEINSEMNINKNFKIRVKDSKIVIKVAIDEEISPEKSKTSIKMLIVTIISSLNTSIDKFNLISN